MATGHPASQALSIRTKPALQPACRHFRFPSSTLGWDLCGRTRKLGERRDHLQDPSRGAMPRFHHRKKAWETYFFFFFFSCQRLEDSEIASTQSVGGVVVGSVGDKRERAVRVSSAEGLGALPVVWPSRCTASSERPHPFYTTSFLGLFVPPLHLLPKTMYGGGTRRLLMVGSWHGQERDSLPRYVCNIIRAPAGSAGNKPRPPIHIRT
jgi:hypothetical protein